MIIRTLFHTHQAYFWFNDDRESVPGVSVMDPKGGHSNMYMILYSTGHFVSI